MDVHVHVHLWIIIIISLRLRIRNAKIDWGVNVHVDVHVWHVLILIGVALLARIGGSPAAFEVGIPGVSVEIRISIIIRFMIFLQGEFCDSCAVSHNTVQGKHTQTQCHSHSHCHTCLA